MTTEVVVKVYKEASFKAKVRVIDYSHPRTVDSTVVREGIAYVLPGHEQSFHAHDTRDILVQEEKL